MVQETPTSPAIAALLRRSETARRRLSYDIAAFKHRVDVPARVRESLQTNPTGWIGGSLLAGLLGSLALKRRKTKPVQEKAKRAGVAGLLLTAAGALLRPMVKSWLAGYLQHSLSSRLGTRHSDQ